jgi:pimeloyl-ACP methyl ester carboxylesterase
MRTFLRLAAAATTAVTAVELLARWNIRREQQARAWLGDRLFTHVVGSNGDPIVVIAGLQGSTRYWKGAFDELATTHRVIYVDLLGFGRSPWPDVEYTLEDHLAALRRTLAALHATRNVTIIAHSFGAVVAAYYAARYVDEIQCLVLAGAPVFDSEAEAQRRIWEMSPLAAMFSLQPILARETCMLMCGLRPLFRHAAPRIRPDLPAAVAEDAVMHSWPSIRGAIRNILLRKPIAAPLRVVGSKSVFLHGTRDTVTPVDRIEALAREVGAKVVLVDGDHHGYGTRYRNALMCIPAPTDANSR